MIAATPVYTVRQPAGDGHGHHPAAVRAARIPDDELADLLRAAQEA